MKIRVMRFCEASYVPCQKGSNAAESRGQFVQMRPNVVNVYGLPPLSSLRALRSTFPTIVFGSSFRNSIDAGTLYGAS
jgi:hypothetical protein